MTDENSRKPAEKQRKKKAMPHGEPFKKNNPETGARDERIKRVATRRMDSLRSMLGKLFDKPTEVDLGEVDAKTKQPIKTKMEQLEFMLRTWILSGDYQKQKAALEYYAGKVPDEYRDLSEIDDFIMGNLDLFTDGQLTRLQQGEDKMVILAEVMRDALKAARAKKK